MVRRNGLKQIEVNESVEFTLSYWNINNYGKKQYSGFINGEYWYLPTHQLLVKELDKIPRGSVVKATRLTKGGPKEACEYDIKVISKSQDKEQQTLI